MIPLSQYINKRIFSVAGSISNKILLFDVDDTLIHTTARIGVKKPDGTETFLSNNEFNVYKLKPGESFDFSEFDSEKILMKERTTKYFETLKREYARGTHIGILTARSNTEMIRNYFLKKGIDIKPSLVFAISDPKYNLHGSVHSRKAFIVKQLIKVGYKNFVFFDDSIENLNKVKELEQPGIKINIVHV